MLCNACAQSDAGFVLSRNRLLDLKSSAMRRGVWFKVLNRIDRVLVDVTIKVADKVHSIVLARTLFSVVQKLEDAFKHGVLEAVRRVGFPLARRFSSLAQKWGSVLARSWASDVSFARFLAVMHINSVALHGS